MMLAQDTVFSIIGGRQHSSDDHVGQMPTLEINGHIKNAPLLELVPIEMAEKIYNRRGQAITVNDGCHVALNKEIEPGEALQTAVEAAVNLGNKE